MGVLLMLMTIGGLIAAAILMTVAIWKKLNWLKKFVIGGVAVWFAFYAIALVGFSLTSQEKVLALNEPKEYCGFYLDCHLHTEITDVRTAKNIGDKTANGTFVIAKVKVFSDAKNPAINFRLLEPNAELKDGNGHAYTRNAEAEKLLPTAQIQLNQDIKGRETIEKEIVFDVAEPTKDLKLLITEGYGIDKVIEAVLICDEDSVLHQKTVFKIEPQSQIASIN
ncbi:MAG: hypothetical protein K1X72_07285 [Pyrinomonadaceae bacterium]|nr:hypothetical protein [Pyrinomonadaceae bacterium]